MAFSAKGVMVNLGDEEVWVAKKGVELALSSAAAAVSPAKPKEGVVLSPAQPKAKAKTQIVPNDSFNAQFQPANNRFKSTCVSCGSLIHWNSKCQCGGNSITMELRNNSSKPGYKRCRCGFSAHHKTSAWVQHVASCT